MSDYMVLAKGNMHNDHVRTKRLVVTKAPLSYLLYLSPLAGREGGNMGEKETGYNHLDLEKRKVVERGLDEGRSLTYIADETGTCVSTVRREIVRNRRCEGRSHIKGADKNDCVHLRGCKRKCVCSKSMTYKGCQKRLCRLCTMIECHKRCKDYVPRTCERAEKAPFVCNHCERYSKCTLERWRYSAQGAQEQAQRRAHDARYGIDMTKEEMNHLVETVRAGLAQGQSVHHIFATEDMPCSERSFYRHVHNEDIDIKPIELAKKVKYKKRKQAKAKSHKSGFYVGHEYEDYLELPEEDRAQTTEVDTVWGKKRDKKCILSLHRIDLHFQTYLLLQERTAAKVVKALDWLEICMEGRFSEFFGLLLLDRGSEFDDIAGIERSCLHEGTRCAAYFCDPSRADQRGAAEKNHVELRKILPKGTCFEGLDPYTLAEICSHVNSSIRKGCGDVSPLELAELVMPAEFFDNLGLRLIPPKDVIGAPGILYRP